MKLLLIPLLSTPSNTALAQQIEVPPLVGTWDYGENRCASKLYGYPTEEAAATGGANRHYYWTRVCSWSVAPQQAWGTREAPSRGSCGSTNLYPEFNMGVEARNTRQYQVTYSFWETCEHGPSSDGLTVFRARTVTCPAGYVASGVKCVRPQTSIDPNKNNDPCPAGGNGSNPIHSALGTKLQREVDVDLGGGLRLVRYYSSANHWGATAFGQHWRHGFDSTVTLSDASGAGGGIAAWVRRPNGDVLAFKQIDDSTWTGDQDVKLRLTPSFTSGQITGWSVRTEENHVEVYDQDGRLVSDEDPVNGRRIFAYDASGRLSSVTNRYGRFLTFLYDNASRISAVLDSMGSQWSYEYDASGRLLRVFRLTGDGVVAHRAYHYEDQRFPYALTGITDENGARYATWTYDASGRAVTSEHGAGGMDRVSLTYNGDGTTLVTDSLGKGRLFSFSQSHGVKRIAGVTAPCASCGAQREATTYDTNGFVDVSVDYSGVATDFDHDSRGLLIQKIEAANRPEIRRIVQTDWHAVWALPVERRTYDASGALLSTYRWTYNERGQTVSSTQSGMGVSGVRATTTTYCEPTDVTDGACPIPGLVLSVDGPRTDINDITTYQYYAADDSDCATTPTTCAWRKGDLWKVTNPAGQVTETLRYDGAGRVLSVKDPSGVITDFEYHPRGWLTARKIRGSN